MRELPATLVVMALPAESAGLFAATQVPVLYCGVGKVNAAGALMRELARYRHAGRTLPLVVNFGSAGSRVHKAGTFLACHQFVQRDMDASGLGFALGVTPFEDTPPCLSFEPLFTQLPAAICGSGDSFAIGAASVACSVLDMEAYALAKMCWLERARFGCVKYITDGADHSAGAAWRCSVHKAADEFLRLYRTLADDRGSSATRGSALQCRFQPN